MSSDTLRIEVAGATLQLLPQRAVYWPAQRMLMIADIHFGKAAAFRAQGVPVPRGTTSDNLARLDALVDALDARQVLFLGDFLHARTSHAPATLAALRRWRAQRSALDLTLVRGNHDERAGDPPADLGITVVDEPYELGGFSFCHHPHAHAQGYVIAGHLHPVFRLSAAGDSLRLPCFVFGSNGGILPSFGAFTGGFAISPQAGERVFVTTGDAVYAVPGGSLSFGPPA
ncbi:MAG TPA: ligase-associated DNA damage response endonuclease PdeM [Oxalicibacterium sp.]|nr:ligase-associated DNA damage response endonuclease PdeM [Oxalicibacterium sp.]